MLSLESVFRLALANSPANFVVGPMLPDLIDFTRIALIRFLSTLGPRLCQLGLLVSLVFVLPSFASPAASASSPSQVANGLPASAVSASLSSENSLPPINIQKRSSDPVKRLKEVERHRKEVHEYLQQARKKEVLAFLKLHNIKAKLNITTDALNQHKTKLYKTETKISDCEQRLTATQNQEGLLSEHAARRLREIYEGQRLSLLEMFFQVSSLPSLIDLFYYQERIAEMDRQLLADLRAKTLALATKRNQLGTQKNMLGDLVSEFARKAFALHKEKLNQEQIAEKLRTQRAFYEEAERQLAQESLQIERQIIDLETANKKSAKNMTQGSGNMTMPLKASITSPFGWRRHPIFGVRRFHTGIDLAGPNHSEIRAADSGNVLYSGWYGGYGKVVIVSHGNSMATLYAHLAKISVRSGQNICKGNVIGLEGTTGFSTGPHLHFEVRVNGKPNNPLNFVRY